MIYIYNIFFHFPLKKRNEKHLLFFKTTIKITLIEQYNLYNYPHIKNKREHLKSIQITNSEQFYKSKTILHTKKQ